MIGQIAFETTVLQLVQCVLEVDKAIQQHRKREVEEEANAKSFLAFLNKSHNANLPHPIWEASSTDLQDMR